MTDHSPIIRIRRKNFEPSTGTQDESFSFAPGFEDGWMLAQRWTGRGHDLSLSGVEVVPISWDVVGHFHDPREYDEGYERPDLVEVIQDWGVALVSARGMPQFDDSAPLVRPGSWVAMSKIIGYGHEHIHLYIISDEEMTDYEVASPA